MVDFLSSSRPDGRSNKRLIISYVFDYAIIIIFIVVFSAFDKMEPFKQHFSKSNISIQYPFAEHERIPPILAGILSCAFPLAVIAVYAFIIDGYFSHTKHRFVQQRRRFGLPARYTLQERLWEFNCGVLGLGLSVAAAIFITGALKNAIGKPRPDMLSRCQPDDTTEPPIGLLSVAVCTGDKHLIRDGFKSFPSGHTSTAFAGLGYLSFYLAGKLHVLDNRGEVWKTVLVVVPLVAAALISGTRIMDARHHPFDVCFSTVMGLVVAWASYRQYFPPLSDVAKKGRAYPMRTWGSALGDEERRGEAKGTAYHPQAAGVSDPNLDHSLTDEEAAYGQPPLSSKSAAAGASPFPPTHSSTTAPGGGAGFGPPPRLPTFPPQESLEMNTIPQHPTTTAYQPPYHQQPGGYRLEPGSGSNRQHQQQPGLSSRPPRSFSSEESEPSSSDSLASSNPRHGHHHKADVGISAATAAVYPSAVQRSRTEDSLVSSEGRRSFDGGEEGRFNAGRGDRRREGPFADQ